ncbi:3'-5' exoribonuclease YhaM [Fictibacillus macauensis ZFHKF-1]|uniref:3'-5' exoribonuclease YhaM n=1 Tax=Fictibacillus macauensis ZFHKF-1 TaxID=1196324 RepID=I8J291_9BACL|nr:3'-5' exoribonuclease YhaM [Fictibacillus macauensis]EIT85861.1 3'-5' exoribonuclease YhaM [Fictibacillus macauensis ZFHKF-1]
MKKGLAHYKVGDVFDAYLMVKASSKSMASNGKPFLNLTLQDQTGDIEAKLWDCSPEDEQVYTPQTLLKVTGEVNSYRGKLQLKIKQIRPTSELDGVRISDFIETAPLSQETMVEEITKYIFEMQNPAIQRLTRHLLKKYQEPFFTYPAAVKNHHEFVSGLAYHVVSMLHLAKSIARLYPTLNTDLLYAGIILHDLGKVIELSGPVAANYTLEGKLLGHISIMVNEIGIAAKELGIEGEEVTILSHLVLSHHSKPEWGSPKAPMVREAEVLHMIDNFDAKIIMMDRVLSKTEPGEFTEKVFALENRSLYKPSFEKEWIKK